MSDLGVDAEGMENIRLAFAYALACREGDTVLAAEIRGQFSTPDAGVAAMFCVVKMLMMTVDETAHVTGIEAGPILREFVQELAVQA